MELESFSPTDLSSLKNWVGDILSPDTRLIGLLRGWLFLKSLGENPYDDVVCDAKISKDVKSEYSEAELEVVSYLLICVPRGNEGSG